MMGCLWGIAGVDILQISTSTTAPSSSLVLSQQPCCAKQSDLLRICKLLFHRAKTKTLLLLVMTKNIMMMVMVVMMTMGKSTMENAGCNAKSTKSSNAQMYISKCRVRPSSTQRNAWMGTWSQNQPSATCNSEIDGVPAACARANNEPMSQMDTFYDVCFVQTPFSRFQGKIQLTKWLLPAGES